MIATEHIKSVSIIGAGSWGTAIAMVLAETHPAIYLKIWAYEKSVVSSINTSHENREYLPDVPLPLHITATNSLKEAVQNSEMVIIAVPSKVVPDISQKMARYISANTCVGFLTKGFCKVQDEILTISQTIERYIPQLQGKTVAISGPSHAEEVSKYFHTCLNVASHSVANRKLFSRLLTSPYVQCRENDDIIGVEVGGTLKNPAAIAAGMISVLPNCGDNLAGALISEALKEMIRLGRHFDAREETMIDISGLGDLVATSLSEHSRNRRFGKDIGRQIMEKGNSLRLLDRLVLRFNPRAVIERMSENLHYLAEGAYAIEPLIELAMENDISVPVYRSLYEVLLNKKDPSLLIETIKDPDRYEEIYRQTKIQISEKKKGLESVRGAAFKRIIEAHVVESFFVKKDGRDVLADPENFNIRLRAYRDFLEKNSGDQKEKELVDAVLQKPSRRNVEPLLRYYINSIADSYTGIVFRGFMILAGICRFFSRLPFGRVKTKMQGNITQLRSLGNTGNIIYVTDNRTLFDFISVLKSIQGAMLPVPRFMVNADALKRPFEAAFIRRSGGFMVDEKKYENPLYRSLFQWYISTMIENGVPLMVSRSFRPGRVDGQLRGDVVESIRNTMFNKSVEVMIAPVSIAYSGKTDAEGHESGLFPLRKHLRAGVIHAFSDLVFLSEFTREPGQSDQIIPHVNSLFRKNRPCFPQILMAKVFEKNRNSIMKEKLEELTGDFLRSSGMNVPDKLRRTIDEGISHLRKRKIIKKADKKYVVENLEAMKELADLF